MYYVVILRHFCLFYRNIDSQIWSLYGNKSQFDINHAQLKRILLFLFILLITTLNLIGNKVT